MIYIQSDSDKTRPHHFDAACAMFGAIDSGKAYRLTSIEEVQSGKFDMLIRNNLFVGSTDFMNAVFGRIGLEDVGVPFNSNREHKIITLEQALAFVKNGEKLFVKPVKTKLFGGVVIDNTSILKYPLDTLVYAYKPFESSIVSEWRVYVHNHKIIDCRNYSGDFISSMDLIDYNLLIGLVNENGKDGFPNAYTMDIAILETGDNVVIEYNDMWAIGNYGLPNDVYLQSLTDRYFEITQN